MTPEATQKCPKCHVDLECYAYKDQICWCLALPTKKIDKDHAHETCLCKTCLSKLPDIY